ncbi:MAG: acyclic terpene utilization AtuA family protein [Pseudomonadota bacterium]|nr:acyclic terpene utilization AtuA family protein [Pseudomonadota bacterium]
MAGSDSDRIIVGNCSGFYGDKVSAARELVEGGPIDVLTGDYLAELTMVILFRQRLKDASRGWVNTHYKQMEEVMGTCLDRGIKVVTNAGGLNPKGCAEATLELAHRLGLNPKVAYIEGDDLQPRLTTLQEQGEPFINMDKGRALADSTIPPVTANAYLGCWGMVEALNQGADIVIGPRVTDAAVVMAPAAWKFGWKRDDWDELAGALAAGHVIECGCQATGGNYAFFEEVPSFVNVGYPLAEIHRDGSFVVTKHPETGGRVSVGTVTAQIMYEIRGTQYLNPDVIAHFDTMRIEQAGEDRVRVSGVKGSNPPPQHKVCINTMGGFKNKLVAGVYGLDAEKKANTFLDAYLSMLGGRDQFERVETQFIPLQKPNPPTNEEAFSMFRVNLFSQDQNLVGPHLTPKLIEMGLANVPGFSIIESAGKPQAFIKYWPSLVDSAHIEERVTCGDSTLTLAPTSQLGLPEAVVEKPGFDIPPVPSGPTEPTALGRVYAARSGDKGGSANVGIWGTTPESYAFLREFLTVERLKEIMVDVSEFEIERHEFPNLFALNFYIHDILQDGVSSSTRMDPQAKTLGEYLRAKVVDIPTAIPRVC